MKMWSIELEFVVGNSLPKIQPGTHVSCLDNSHVVKRTIHKDGKVIISLWFMTACSKHCRENREYEKKKKVMEKTDHPNA